MGRYILHCDLNNFYASVESLYNPEIRNRAVVVVGDEEKRHGIVLAKNAVAKEKGVKTGDVVWEARQKCGDLVCVPARHELYLWVSKQVKDIYREYSSRVESFGIDEAWIDISHLARNDKEAVEIANNIRSRVIAEIGLTISVGVSFNKIFAKLGSDMQKPNATVLVSRDNYQAKAWPLPVGELLYVGRATKRKLERANIMTIGDLARTSVDYLKLTLGKVGEELWKFANGLEDSEVARVDDADKVKSFGNSTTCPIDLTTDEEVKSVIYVLAESVAERMAHKGYYGSTVSLWVKDNSLTSFDRQATLSFPTNVSSDIGAKAYELFKACYDWHLPVRAVGVRITSLSHGDLQVDIFSNLSGLEKHQKLERTIETLRARFGYNSIRRGNIMGYEELSNINPHSETHIIHPVGFFKGR
ncbi:MAG: DNA polymerase IV [Clostridiales bacterium]|nr:DNA polymerase IV [Clostridiales bacterium]